MPMATRSATILTERGLGTKYSSVTTDTLKCQMGEGHILPLSRTGRPAIAGLFGMQKVEFWMSDAAPEDTRSIFRGRVLTSSRLMHRPSPLLSAGAAASGTSK